MAYSGLADFIADLQRNDEIHRITSYVNPVLEIAEITDRVTKVGGKALLFENNGTDFPVLINAFGSDKRLSLAIGRNNLSGTADKLENIFARISVTPRNVLGKISDLPQLLKIVNYLPVRLKRKGLCQQVIHKNPDLGILPVLKCWPHDGGRFITLPIVHTIHPETAKTNAGMYRMQILGKNSAAMHWQRHKTGANHFEAWKKTKKSMPVSIVLGGDPVYTYAATAPLPENIDEYILAGFLRKKKVRLVKCITNDLFVPYDSDIVIEGYVDSSEDPVSEGPFGDHTGFYSLVDSYPRLHVTCITHSKRAVFPATIVGIPPHEDAWFAKATEKIFLSPLRMVLQPEIIDFHMPVPGVAHNLVIVKIKKTFPGQGVKVISSLFGAGQMMFTKYLVVVNGNVDIRNYKELMHYVFNNTCFRTDLVFINGPLDVLDHSSDSFSFGGKIGIDATFKHPEEIKGKNQDSGTYEIPEYNNISTLLNNDIISSFNINLLSDNIPLLILSVDPSRDPGVIRRAINLFETGSAGKIIRLFIAVDHTVDLNDYFMVAWQLLSNSDPFRDNALITPSSLFIDGTIKAYREGGFPRKWPNIVCSDSETINNIDKKWDSLGFDRFLPSPSLKYTRLLRTGDAEIIIE